MLCENISNSPLLEKALEKTYDKGIIPKDHPYKRYQLFDIDDEVALEFICKKIIIKRNDIHQT